MKQLFQFWVLSWFITIFVCAGFNWKIYHPKWAKRKPGENYTYSNIEIYRFLLMFGAPISWLYLIAKWAKQPRTKVVGLSFVLENYLPGSFGDNWTWEDENNWLWENDYDKMRELMRDIELNGIEEPILLGNDWRVWDGHHRICIARNLRILAIPVEFAK